MAYPVGWPPRPATGRRSGRVYIDGNTTALWDDNGYLFDSVTGANTYTPTPVVPAGARDTQVTYSDHSRGSSPGGGRKVPEDTCRNPNSPFPEAQPVAMFWVQTLRISNDAAAGGTEVIEFTFDGTNVQGTLKAGESRVYRNRFEAGIAVRAKATTGPTIPFRIEGW